MKRSTFPWIKGLVLILVCGIMVSAGSAASEADLTNDQIFGPGWDGSSGVITYPDYDVPVKSEAKKTYTIEIKLEFESLTNMLNFLFSGKPKATDVQGIAGMRAMDGDIEVFKSGCYDQEADLTFHCDPIVPNYSSPRLTIPSDENDCYCWQCD
jgi:hypothetical protein